MAQQIACFYSQTILAILQNNANLDALAILINAVLEANLIHKIREVANTLDHEIAATAEER